MTDILVVAERRGGALRKVAFEAMSAGARLAQALGGRAVAAVIGPDGRSAAEELARYGAAAAYVLEGDELQKYSAEGYAGAVAELAADLKPGYVLATASAEGRDWMPRLAAQLGAPLVADVIGAEVADGRIEFTRALYAGKAIARLAAHGATVAATLRPKLFAAVAVEPAAGFAVQMRRPALGQIRAVLAEILAAAGGKIDVTEADIIVAGGRGLGKDPQLGFKILGELAETLGAAVGASRAAVDAGWVPHAQQVGQTGKVVNPTLYVACGISGAVQHLAGMSGAKVIVAVNKDPEAPIFKIADFGIVGDLFEVVPALKRELAAALEGAR